jgi:alpha-tubulin suppressor-like RCC1 family protein
MFPSRPLHRVFSGATVFLFLLTPHVVRGDQTISKLVLGVPMSITVRTQYAGAIASFVWNNRQFVDNFDHGRQFQTAAKLFGKGECYNPTEAGWHGDGATSSSILLSLTTGTTSPNYPWVDTRARMAWWLRDKEYEPTTCFDDIPGHSPPTKLGNTSYYQVHKKVTIGYHGIENVIEYPTDLYVPEAVWNGEIEPAGCAMPIDFSVILAYDVATKSYQTIREPNGEDDSIRVRMIPNNSGGSDYALAFYSPELLQPYGDTDGGFRWSTTTYPGWPVVSIGGISRFKGAFGPGTLSYRSFLVVGNKDQVKAGLDSLHFEFRTIDLEVFNWREYLFLNPGLPSSWDLNTAQNDWINSGIGGARAGSFSFSPPRYLQLNSDISGAYGATNYWGAIDHYIGAGRKEGRTTVPRAEGGMQHTTVRTPQLPYNVNVRASGQNVNGQLGTGTTSGSWTPVQAQLPMFPRVTEVAAGDYTSLAVLADGTVWMWGSNTYGARGDGTTGGQDPTPRQVTTVANVVVPSVKDRHVIASAGSACAAVDTNGYVWTWGAGWSGQLGNGSTNARYTPGKVQKSSNYGGGDLDGIVSVSIGQSQMAALDADGHIWTWGSNQNGALGNNTTGDSSTAVMVVGAGNGPLGGMTQVVAGGSSFCVALARNGIVWAWGNNGSGQLGDGSSTSSSYAKPVTYGPLYGPFVDKIAAGSYHALAHTRDGLVFGWGYNGWGELGNPQAAVNQRTPIQMSLTNGMDNKISDIASGNYFSLMIRANAAGSTIFAVGDNQSGQLGCYGVGCSNNATQTSPVQTGF